MKKKLLCLILTLFTVSAFSQDITRQRLSVVVLPGSDAGRPDKITRILNLTVEQMDRLGRFEIIDRRTTDQKIAELKLRLSGILDDDSVIEIGNMIGSDIGMIVDLANYSITEYEKNVETETDGRISVAVETVYDAAIDITVRQFEINTTRAMKTISVTGEGSGSSKVAAEEEAYRAVKGKLFNVLKEFYPLILTVTELNGNHILVSGGENLGVKKGMKFDVMEKSDDFDRSGLVLIEKVGGTSSVARILKGFKTIRNGYLLEERINRFPETAISVSIANNFEQELTALDIAFEFNTFNPFSAGFDIVFSLSDPDVDYIKTNIFGVYKPVLSDYYDLGIRGGLGLSFLYGIKDDDSNNISRIDFQLFTGAVADFYFNEKIGFFTAADYMIYPATIMDWSYHTGSGEERTRHDAVGNIPDFDLDGFCLTFGIKIIP